MKYGGGLINQVLLAYKEDICRRLKEFALEEWLTLNDIII